MSNDVQITLPLFRLRETLLRAVLQALDMDAEQHPKELADKLLAELLES